MLRARTGAPLAPEPRHGRTSRLAAPGRNVGQVCARRRPFPVTPQAPVCRGGSWKGTKSGTVAPRSPTLRPRRPHDQYCHRCPRARNKAKPAAAGAVRRDRYRYGGITGNGNHPSSGGYPRPGTIDLHSSRRGDLTLRQEIEWNRRHPESEAVVLLKSGPKARGCWALPERSRASGLKYESKTVMRARTGA